MNSQILLHAGLNGHFNFKSAFRFDASANSKGHRTVLKSITKYALHDMVILRNFIWTMHRFADHIIQYKFDTTNPQSVVNVNRPTGLQVTYTVGPIHAHPSQLAKTEQNNESSCVISPSLLMRRWPDISKSKMSSISKSFWTQSFQVSS